MQVEFRPHNAGPPEAARPPRLLRQAMAALLAAAAAAAVFVPAQAAEDSDGKHVESAKSLDLHAGSGMSAPNPRVEAMLKAHPDDYAVICVAGCGGKSRIVQLLPKPVVGRTAEHLESTAKMDGGTYGPPSPGQARRSAMSEQNDVVCLAGCVGRPGKVLQTINDLPPQPGLTAKAKTKAKEPAPAHP